MQSCINTYLKKYLLTAILSFGVFIVPTLVFAVSASTYSVSSISGSCAMLQGASDINNRWFEIKEIDKNMTPITVGGRSFFSGSNSGQGGSFQAEATRLKPDTRYVYRAVAQSGGTIAYGQESSFTTKSALYQKNQSGDSFMGCSQYVPMTTNTNVIIDINTGEAIPSGSVALSQGSQTYYSSGNTQTYYGSQQYYSSGLSVPLNQSLNTLNATEISDTSARLNAKTFPTQNVVQYGRFLWGKTTALGNSTPRISLGSGAALAFFQEISGLLPGTTYYYKPVVDNQLGTAEGILGSFTTQGTNPSSSNNQSNYVAYTSESAEYYSNPQAGAGIKNTTNPTNSSISKNISSVIVSDKTEKTIIISDETDTIAVAPGGTIKKSYSFANNTGGNITDVQIKAILPDNETFIAKNSDPFSVNGQLITINVGNMSSGQKISVTYWANVSKETKDKSYLDTLIMATAKDSSGMTVKSVGNTSILVDAGLSNRNTAAVALADGSYSIFPKTLTDWFVIIILLFVSVFGYFSWRYFQNKKLEEKEEEGIPGILAIDPADVPKKPLTAERKFVKDPFYGNNKNESFSDMVHQEEKKIVEIVVNTVKSAPPDNLPV